MKIFENFENHFFQNFNQNYEQKYKKIDYFRIKNSRRAGKLSRPSGKEGGRHFVVHILSKDFLRVYEFGRDWYEH